MRRYYAKLLRSYLSYFPCVSIVGARQCGKTTFLGELPKGWTVFDLERSSDYQVIARDPDLFFRLNPRQVAIDEAQLLPSLFPALRVAIDSDRKRTGRFVITGSSSPELLRSVSETLAGRVGIIEMAPFSCAEAFNVPRSPFFDWFAQQSDMRELLGRLRPKVSLRNLHRFWFEGGYPEPWLNRKKGFRQAWMENFSQTYLQRDIASHFPALNRERFRLFLGLLAGVSGTILNYSDVARSLGVSSPTVRDYFEIAHGTFLWRTVPAFERKAGRRLVRHPRGHLRDSGLQHFLLRIPSVDSLLAHPRMGASWEGMVTEEILRGLTSRGVSHTYSYYRTHVGAEIDLVLQGAFGVVPIEIKYGHQASAAYLRTMREFVQKNRSTCGFVINNDREARLVDERILSIPFGWL
jgi:predicted AAA+ superfamily ATPase